MGTRRELVRETGVRYRQAGRDSRGHILDEFVAMTGYHRKHALRLLNSSGQPEGSPLRPPRSGACSGVASAALGRRRPTHPSTREVRWQCMRGGGTA